MDVLIRGTANFEIHLGIIGHWNQDLNREGALRFIKAKEIGECSANKLLSGQGAKCRTMNSKNLNATTKTTVLTVANKDMVEVIHAIRE